MKFLSSLFALALCFTVCAQFTSDPPGKHGQVFNWTTQPPGRVVDSDARDFAKRAALTDPVQVSAVNILVRDLKKAGIWKKLVAFYPFVGGTSQSCSQNLRSPRYTISWEGAVTFGPSGVTGDGETCFGDTGYPPSKAANPSSFHMYVWVWPDAATAQGGIMGTGVNSPSSSHCYLSFHDADGTFMAHGPNSANGLGGFFPQGGNLLWQRTNSMNIEMWNDAQHFWRTAPLTAPTTTTIKVLAAPGVYGPSTPGSLRAASFGSALTEEEVAFYFAAVNRFQTAVIPLP